LQVTEEKARAARRRAAVGALPQVRRPGRAAFTRQKIEK
jgi:hypothetical protein